jgi:hypothetical protein
MFHNFLLYWPALIILLGNACHHKFRASYLSLKISSETVCNMPANTVPGRQKKNLSTQQASPTVYLCVEVSVGMYRQLFTSFQKLVLGIWSIGLHLDQQHAC